MPTSRSCSRTSPTSASSSWTVALLGTPRSISRHVTTLVGSPSTWRTWSGRSSGQSGGRKSTRRSTGPSRRKRRSMCSLFAKVDAVDRLPTSASCSSWSRTMVSRNGTINHLNQFGRHNCGGGCADCRWEAPGAREKAMACVDLARKLWKENAESLKPPRPVRLAHPAVRAQQVTSQGAFSTKWGTSLQHRRASCQRSRHRPRPGLQPSPSPSRCRGA